MRASSARLILAAMLALCCLAPLAATAQAPRPANAIAVKPSTAKSAAPQIHVDLEAGTGRLIDAPNGTTEIFVADPKVVDVRPGSAESLFMFGVSAGHTSVAVLDKDGHPGASFDITVSPSSFAASGANAALARAMPNAGVRVEATPKGLVLTGQVPDAGKADMAQGIARSYLGENQEVENRLTLASPQQVGLRVRIVEMSRTVTNALGINWSALGRLGQVFGEPFRIGLTTAMSTGSGTTGAAGSVGNTLSVGTSNLDALINAMAGDNLARVLAEPNLTAMSGETASFLAGGEFPIPVGQSNNTVTIEFKQYGVALAFVPTVISDHQIRLRVRPEVSQLTQQGAVQIAAGNSTISIPALTVRRADTTVELGSGQSFAIAGLLQYNSATMSNFVPLLGDVPVLGELFRSEGFQRNETELVIIVTPYLVKAVDKQEAFRTPGEGGLMLSDLERMLALRNHDPTAHPARIPGQAGFLMP